MFIKDFTYKNYNGEEITEQHYFNLTRSEILDAELSEYGGMSEILSKIISTKDTPELMKVFKNLIFKSYGIKSPDGRRFIKSKTISEEFSQTPAYDMLFMELVTEDKAAAEFINNIIPEDLRENEHYKAALESIEASNKENNQVTLLDNVTPINS